MALLDEILDLRLAEAKRRFAARFPQRETNLCIKFAISVRRCLTAKKLRRIQHQHRVRKSLILFDLFAFPFDIRLYWY